MTTRKMITRQPALNRLRLRLRSNSNAGGNWQRRHQVLARTGAPAYSVPRKQDGQTERTSGFQVVHHAIELQTAEPLQFIDLTDEVRALVAQSGIANGMVNIQTRHTTTTVIINEHEPLLLDDLKDLLTRLAPQHAYYRHNDFAIRTANMTPDESPNGHAHCQSLLLSSAATVNIIDGALQLGRWQRIFFIELDHARPRTVALTVMGQAAAPDFAKN